MEQNKDNMVTNQNPYRPMSDNSIQTNSVSANQPSLQTNESDSSQHIYTESWMTQNSNPSVTVEKLNSILGEVTRQIPIQSSNQSIPEAQNYQVPIHKDFTVYHPQSQFTGIGFSIAGMVCGIISMLTCIFMIFNLTIAVPGLVFSLVSLSKKYKGRGMAIAGTVCSGVGIFLSLGFMLLCLTYSI